MTKNRGVLHERKHYGRLLSLSLYVYILLVNKVFTDNVGRRCRCASRARQGVGKDPLLQHITPNSRRLMMTTVTTSDTTSEPTSEPTSRSLETGMASAHRTCLSSSLPLRP